MKALGTDSIEEAMAIAESAGIKQEDIPALLMSHGLQYEKSKAPVIPPQSTGDEIKLTRK